MDSTNNVNYQKDKIIIIMGATGVGKSRLSIELATHFLPSEIINSDKMQVYRGLDITTNKVPLEDRLGIRHHFIGEFDPEDGELSASQFGSLAASTIKEIVARKHLPIVVGGSLSFIHALISGQCESDFDGLESGISELRYDCCFLWLDVSLPVLCEYLGKRLNEMLDSGMFQELAEFYNPKYDSNSSPLMGIWKSIGVPEFNQFFFCFPPSDGGDDDNIGSTVMDEYLKEDEEKKALFDKVAKEMKDNTCELAKRQTRKIEVLRSVGWDIHRLDATGVFKEVLALDGVKAKEIWGKEVFEPSVKIVKDFLET